MEISSPVNIFRRVELDKSTRILKVSRLSTFPEDLETYVANSKVALLINSYTKDPPFNAEVCAKAEELFGGGKFVPGYKSEFFEGYTHGFGVRGDMSDPRVKAGKEGAFKVTVEWLMEKL